MSDLNEILTSPEELEAAVNVCKNNILSYLERVYVEFLERPKRKKLFINRLSALQEQISNVTKQLQTTTDKDLKSVENDVETHLISLKKIQFTLEALEKLYQFHEKIMEIKDLKREQSYFGCMEKILEAEELIKNVGPFEKLEVLEEFSLALILERSSLLKNMTDVFEDHIILEPAENMSVLKISTNNDILDEILKALYLYQTSVAPLDNITKFLWNYVFVPVVDYTTEIKTKVEDNFMIMEVITVDPNKKSSYAEVFANIKMVLNFLSNNFHTSLDKDLTSLSYIGRDIKGNLSELIVKHCLQDTIPSTVNELNDYPVVIKATEDLEKTLILANIFADTESPLLEFVNRADDLFITKKCQHYLSQARTLMKKDLHDLVEVGEVVNDLYKDPSPAFPRCSVSSSVLDLLRLMETILTEATSLSESFANRLFRLVQDICLMYIEFVPEQHKKLLQTIPQQIAVFYNNCMYISHKLTNWKEVYSKQLTSSAGINCFSDKQMQLETVASNMFTSYVDGQINQIKEVMKGTGLQQQTLEQVEPSVEKSLRQCLRQQELLRTVWHKVLPYNLYNKSVGAILDELCKYIITTLVNVEDISTSAAEQLVEMLKMVQTRGSKLFTDPKEVALFVSSWYTLNELVFVLGANLLDINDRWAEGKGPLALQFKPEELKQLIRALFQNTERRAALLAKIM